MTYEYIVIGGASLYLGDCMDYMRGLPDKAFDLAIVDPPYGIGNFVQTSGNVRGAAVTWNDSIPLQGYFDELERVSVERIIWGANYYNCFNDKGGAIVWWKRVPPESNLSECEIASYSRLKRVAYVDIRWQNIGRGEAMVHPCQKPVKIYEWLLTNYAEPGQRILDTHLGSGSSAIAANNLGFDFVGVELDADYYAAACQRVARAYAQPRLFAPVTKQAIQQTFGERQMTDVVNCSECNAAIRRGKDKYDVVVDGHTWETFLCGACMRDEDLDAYNHACDKDD